MQHPNKTVVRCVDEMGTQNRGEKSLQGMWTRMPCWEVSGEATHLCFGLLVPLLALAWPPALLFHRLIGLGHSHARVRVHVGVWVSKVRKGHPSTCRTTLLHALVRRVRIVCGWLPHPASCRCPPGPLFICSRWRDLLL
jgi:hypothetical protein